MNAQQQRNAEFRIEENSNFGLTISQCLGGFTGDFVLSFERIVNCLPYSYEDVSYSEIIFVKTEEDTESIV